MDVLERHQREVRNWREQLERMLHLHTRIFEAQKESWALRAHYSSETEQQIAALHESIDNMSQEIELIREAFFGNLQRRAAQLRPSHALQRDDPPPGTPAPSAAGRPAAD
ncbi:MAG: hypothetical protein HY342_13365 [Candidatus Lambdaproteobacteria bacterium]|nr:hypothetical protein [Candidatus Lambdaproteobacteria bacterium]